MGSPEKFDHEKLDVYQLELRFLAWVSQFLADISGPLSAQSRELREKLDRASLSALLNTAEGNGRRQGRQRAKFFDDARGSAIECAACLDASVAGQRICFFATNSIRQRNVDTYRGHAHETGRAL
jgi:four helix bundle protein